MDNSSPEKPKLGWFEQLETESWSAELIISGAAIYGTLQLPWLFNRLVDFSLLKFSDDILGILYLVYNYLAFAITILIVNFVVHFILRSLWVGLIGLSSVFPQGVNTESESYSKDYLQKLKADFGDLRAYHEKIDRTCSVIFAFSFSIAMIFVSIALVVLVVALLAFWLHRIFPGTAINNLFFILLYLVMLPGFIGGILNHKKLREKAWVKRIHYPLIMKFAGYTTFHMFYKPIFYINSTFSTNFKKGQFSLRMVGYMILILPIFFLIFFQSNVLFASKDHYFNHANRADRFYYYHYEDQLKEGQLIQSPLIPSSDIEGPGLSLFLPLPTREEMVLRKKYGKYSQDSTLSKAENALKSRAWFLEQANKYFQIKVNGKKFTPILRSYIHRNANEFGFMASIPAEVLKEGENVIQIRSEYSNEGKKRECFIPFWFSPK